MARPQRNNVDYFPFLCEEGEKMYYIEETYGNDGFATFIKILRELAKTDYHYLNLSKNTTLMFLSARCKVNKETLEAIINDLVDLGKFDSVLWKENKIIWCQDFIDSIQDAYSKRSNTCIDYNSLLVLLDSLGIRKLSKRRSKQSKNNSQGGVNPQSIVDYSKVEESKLNDNIPPRSEFLDYVLGKKPNVDLEEINLKYDSWVENDWKDGYDKDIKNWKSKVCNVLKYIGESKKPEKTYTHKVRWVGKAWQEVTEKDYLRYKEIYGEYDFESETL